MQELFDFEPDVLTGVLEVVEKNLPRDKPDELEVAKLFMQAMKVGDRHAWQKRPHSLRELSAEPRSKEGRRASSASGGYATERAFSPRRHRSSTPRGHGGGVTGARLNLMLSTGLRCRVRSRILETLLSVTV